MVFWQLEGNIEKKKNYPGKTQGSFQEALWTGWEEKNCFKQPLQTSQEEKNYQMNTDSRWHIIEKTDCQQRNRPYHGEEKTVSMRRRKH